MCQLARKDHLNIQNNYIQAILRGNKQLAAIVHCLKFENKRLIEALKAEKKKRNRNKKPNLLDKEDNGPQLFLLLKVQAACNFVYDKKVKKEQQKRNIKKKK